MMGGDLRLNSAPGRGSTFSFAIRVGVDAAYSGRPQLALPAHLQGLRALVVDDHEVNRCVLEETLRFWGLEPTLTTGAEQALAALGEAQRAGTPFTLLLVDVQMPGKDGFTFVEEAQIRFGLDGAAVVMLTSGARPDDLDRCRRLGLAAHLTKPVRQAELLRTIQMVVGRIPEPRRVDAAGKGTAGAERIAVQGAVTRLRILVAEDNMVNQHLAAALLAKRGQDSVIVSNGREAVDAWTSGSFDAIFMDVQMPEMDGFEATATIRGAERGTNRRIPIVAMTAHAMTGDRERCLAAGMDDYVTKPISIKEIDRVLQDLIRHRTVVA
jgi:two-component system sensor histidine kinase/response regulator